LLLSRGADETGFVYQFGISKFSGIPAMAGIREEILLDRGFFLNPKKFKTQPLKVAQ